MQLKMACLDGVKYRCNGKMMQKVKKHRYFPLMWLCYGETVFPSHLLSPTRELLMNAVTMGALPLCSKFTDSRLVRN